MKVFTVFLVALFFAITACTLDKTDYEDEINSVIPEYYDFKEVISFNSGIYKINLEALNGTLYKGYNDIRLKIINTQKNESLMDSEITFLPLLTKSNGEQISCPHSDHLTYTPLDNYYSGYSVFINESGSENWKIQLSFTDGTQSFSVEQHISVHKQVNKNLNMTLFTGNDNQNYVIALKAPQKPNVSENPLVAGIYKENTTPNEPESTIFSYSEATGYILQLDPRMPEPSMGNHSSLNNRDLTQQPDGFYHGIVNYTMTGNWTLNFIMLNENGKIIKGTKVPTDFTPGVEGVKSELHIDILF